MCVWGGGLTSKFKTPTLKRLQDPKYQQTNLPRRRQSPLWQDSRASTKQESTQPPAPACLHGRFPTLTVLIQSEHLTGTRHEVRINPLVRMQTLKNIHSYNIHIIPVTPMHSSLSLVSCQRTDMGLQQNSIGDISGNLVAPWSRAFWRHHVVCGGGG